MTHSATPFGLGESFELVPGQGSGEYWGLSVDNGIHCIPAIKDRNQLTLPY